MNHSATPLTPTSRYPILHPSLFTTPKKSFQLHIYAEAFAHALVLSILPSIDNRCFLRESRILEFLDISAIQNDEHVDHSSIEVSDVSSASPSSSNSCESP
jgi:hypothetical protein